MWHDIVYVPGQLPKQNMLIMSTCVYPIPFHTPACTPGPLLVVRQWEKVCPWMIAQLMAKLTFMTGRTYLSCTKQNNSNSSVQVLFCTAEEGPIGVDTSCQLGTVYHLLMRSIIRPLVLSNVLVNLYSLITISNKNYFKPVFAVRFHIWVCPYISVGMHSCMQYNYRPDRNKWVKKMHIFRKWTSTSRHNSSDWQYTQGRIQSRLGTTPNKTQEANRGKSYCTSAPQNKKYSRKISLL